MRNAVDCCLTISTNFRVKWLIYALIYKEMISLGRGRGGGLDQRGGRGGGGNMGYRNRGGGGGGGGGQ